MADDRPAVDPAVLASLVDAAPKRLIRKLDKNPTVADGWSWDRDGEAWTVTSDSGETVRLAPAGPAIGSTEEVSCTCLLSPRCLHLLATLRSLPLSEGAEAVEDEDVGEGDAEDAVVIDDAKHAAAVRAFDVAARVLDAGADASGTVLQADVLRAVHGARAVGLARLASGGLRTVQLLRDFHAGKASFSLPDLSAALVDVLGTAHHLQSGDAATRWIGTARRRYHDAGSLRLHGLFTEPVVARSGYAGVVTWLVDGDGRLYNVPDVMPGEPGRAAAAYDAGVRIGDASLAHRDLCRQGLFVSNATASRDGRLGAGKDVEAVRSGASSWHDEAPRALFETPLREQLDRAWAALPLPAVERPCGSDLLFIPAVVIGSTRDALVVALPDGGALRCVSASDRSGLAYRDNLRRLSEAPGLEAWIVGRVVFRRAHTVELLAVGVPAPREHPDGSADEGAPRFQLPEAFAERANIGLDRLQGAHVSSMGKSPSVELAADARGPDPLVPLRRRLNRLALGGRASLPPAAMPEVARETALLERRMMKSGADALRALAVSATTAERTISGNRASADPAELARAWLVASHWERAATRALERAAW